MSERKLLKKFLNDFFDSADYYIFVDRDSPGRRFRTGWDGHISRSGRVVYIEAKKSDSNISDWNELLLPSQKKHKKKILQSGGIYVILVFSSTQVVARFCSQKLSYDLKGEFRISKAIKKILNQE